MTLKKLLNYLIKESNIEEIKIKNVNKDFIIRLSKELQNKIEKKCILLEMNP